MTCLSKCIEGHSCSIPDLRRFHVWVLETICCFRFVYSMVYIIMFVYYRNLKIHLNSICFSKLMFVNLLISFYQLRCCVKLMALFVDRTSFQDN